MLSVITVWVLLKSRSFLSNCKGSVECATTRSVSNDVFIKPLYKQMSILIARLTSFGSVNKLLNVNL